jgi:hypothetical protein
MCRFRAAGSVPSRGRSHTAAFLASVRSSNSSSARAMMIAGSRSGTWCESRSCSCPSAACASSPTVTRIRYRRGDSGATSARGPADGAATRAGARSPIAACSALPVPIATRLAPSSAVTVPIAPVTGGEIRGSSTARCGSATTRDATSGFGAISATSLSISRLLRCRARARSSTWFSSIMCGASIVTAVKWISPRAIIWKMTGNRRAVRAAQIRLAAAPSDRWSRSTQNANIDPVASRRYSPRRSTSARYTSSSAVTSFDRATNPATPASTRSSDILSRQTFSILLAYHAVNPLPGDATSCASPP